jgi:hypothetical protein
MMTSQPRIRSLTMLNEMGDTTITWTEDRDDLMAAAIQKKMDAGCTFFIVDSRFGSRQRLQRAADANKHRILAIPDEDFAKFMGDGTIDVVKTPEVPARTRRKAVSAKDAAENHTIGVAPRRAG